MPRLATYYADAPRNKALKDVLAENVRAAMAAKGMKQQHVAALAKQKGMPIDQTTVGRIARAEIPTTVEKLQALAAGLGLEPWQLLLDGLDMKHLPQLGGDLAADEQQLLGDYRTASSRWKISVRYMAGLRQDDEQEQVAEGVNMLLARILGSKPYPVEKMGPGWRRPDAMHEPEPVKGAHRFSAQDGEHAHRPKAGAKKRITR